MIETYILLGILSICITISTAFINVGKKESRSYTIFCYFTGLIVGIITCVCFILLSEKI